MNDFLQSLRNNQAEKPRPQKTRKSYDNSYHYTSQPRFQSYGGSGYQNNRNQHAKRPPAQHPPGNQLPGDEMATPPMLLEAIENLTSHIETLAKNQDYLVTAQERTADMLERQTIAIEKIVDHFNRTSWQKTEPEQQTAPEASSKKQATPSRKTEPEPEQQTAPEASFKKQATPSPEPEFNKVEPSKKKKAIKSIVRKKKKISIKESTAAPSTDNKLLSREAIMDIIHNMRTKGATFDQVASHLVDLNQPTFSGRGEWHAQTIHRLCNKK